MIGSELDLYITKVKEGDSHAFKYIVEKFQALAFNIALPIVKNEADAEEVVQDAFVKIYRFINQYNGESRFSSWLYKVVYNTALTKASMNSKQFLRSQEIEKNIIHKAHKWSNEIEEDFESEYLKRYISNALDKLPETDRLIVTLFYLGEKSIVEIAEITSWKKSKCKVKLMRARQKLAEIIKEAKKETHEATM